MSASAQRRVRERVKASSRQAYQEAIFAAATEVFGRLGYRAAKISDIAVAAGVATGTVYNYFENKEAAFAAIVDRGRSELFGRIEALLACRRGIAGLEALLQAVFATLDERSALFSVYAEATGLQTTGSPESDPGAAAGRAVFHGYLESAVAGAVAAGELRDDVPIADLALAFDGLLTGFIAHWVASGRGFRLADRAGLVLDLFIHGAGRPAPGSSQEPP